MILATKFRFDQNLSRIVSRLLEHISFFGAHTPQLVTFTINIIVQVATGISIIFNIIILWVYKWIGL